MQMHPKGKWQIMRAYFPTTTDEVFQCLDKSPNALICAGGTDLMVVIRQGLIPRPEAMIFLENVSGLKDIREENNSIFIGACATHADIGNHPMIQKQFPVLRKGIDVLGSPLIRNMGTIGGNICTASPAGDTLPPLFVLEAELLLKNRDRMRTVSINKFLKGPKQTIIEPGEILIGIRIDKPNEMTIQHYEKVGQRKALAIAIVSMAAVIEQNRDGIVKRARFAWGSVAPTVVSFPQIDQFFEGQPLSSKVIAEAADMVQKLVSPIDDIRAAAKYRKKVAGNLLFRLGI